MADPFVAEIRIFPFNFAPKGWAWCDGQLLPLSQNTALFSLLGTTYGGNGKSNFALPDLQGRAPMHPGQGPGLSLHDLGETGGVRDGHAAGVGDAGASHMRYVCAGGPSEWHNIRRIRLAVLVKGNWTMPTRPPSQRLQPMAAGDTGAGRRRPAAQQPAAVPDVLLRIALQGVFPPRGT